MTYSKILSIGVIYAGVQAALVPSETSVGLFAVISAVTLIVLPLGLIVRMFSK